MLIQLLHALGIVTVNEQLVKRCIGILLNVSFNPSIGFPAYPDIYSMVCDFKASLTVPPSTPCSFSTLAAYPDDPESLPPAIFKAIYGDKKPVKVILDRLESTLRHIPMRKNSELLKANTPTGGVGNVLGGQQPAINQLAALLGRDSFAYVIPLPSYVRTPYRHPIVLCNWSRS